MMSKIDFSDPRKMDYVSYCECIKNANLDFQRVTANELKKQFDSSNNYNYCITSVGSDGRLEKGLQSKMGVIVFSLDFLNDVDFLHSILNSCIAFNSFDPDIEFKAIDYGFISYYKSCLSKPYPERVLDSRFLYGNFELCDLAIESVYRELQGNYGKNITERFKKKKSEGLRITRNGYNKFKGEKFVHYDLDNGVSYYDCENSMSVVRGSFKFGPLRSVQNALNASLYSKINNFEVNLDFVKLMPTNITEKLSFIQNNDLSELSEMELGDLIDNYQYFLWQYHNSQESWRLDLLNEVYFDKNEVSKRISDLVKILSSGKRLLK